MKRFGNKKPKDKALKNKPLEAQLAEDREIKPKNRVKRRKNEEENEEEIDNNVITKNVSSKILAQAREQMYEEDMDNENRDREANRERKVKFNKVETHSDDEDKFSDVDEEEYNPSEWEEQINDEDERAMELFMSREAPKRLTLADIIMEKLQEQEQNLADQPLDQTLASRLDPKIVQVYTKIGVLLNRYKSGRIPKAFKMIPSLSNWEEIVYLTKPEEWSSQATRQATRLFASNLNSKMAQRFYNLILLPKIRYDIQMNRKLNFHLYFSLKKALYKPAAFYKGLLLPLCEARDCTLREAAVIGSLLAKVSIPILHSSVAILKIAEMEYSGACSLFLRILLNKKYALPYRVVDAVVEHFGKFMDDDRKLPLLWHQSMLVFVQRYKSDLLPEQKEVLKAVIKKQPHYYFTEEIRRELNNSKSRGEQEETKVADLDMDLDE